MDNYKVFNVPDYDESEVAFLDSSEPARDCTEDYPEDYPEDCTDSCKIIDDFLSLTDDMIEDIISLEEELVRWRQVLIKYLPKELAEGLRQDIFDNMARGYAGDPAYDLYVQVRGSDPQQSWEHAEYMQRLADGTDETSITYL